jgi:hypothetical protein
MEILQLEITNTQPSRVNKLTQNPIIHTSHRQLRQILVHISKNKLEQLFGERGNFEYMQCVFGRKRGNIAILSSLCNVQKNAFSYHHNTGHVAC